VESFDVVIVGAGPTGLACGIELKKRGVRAVLIDKGCVVNSIYHYPNNMVFFTTPELLEIGDIPMTSLPSNITGASPIITSSISANMSEWRRSPVTTAHSLLMRSTPTAAPANMHRKR
jgi:flavin-dependent dehydrogenase